MAVYIQELKKLLRPCLLAVSLLLFAGLFCTLTLPNLIPFTYPSTHQPVPQPNALEAVYHSDCELAFTDLLLAEYGNTIESLELSRFRQQTERFCAQLRETVQADPQLQAAHMVLDEQCRIQSDPSYAPAKGDDSDAASYSPYVLDCISGRIQLPGTDYPIAFAGMMQELLQTLEAAASAGGTVLYHVSVPALLTSEIANFLMPFPYAALCGLILIVPYASLENRSGTMQLFCATRIGRRIERCRMGALCTGALGLTATGALLTAVQFIALDLERYYPLPAELWAETTAAYADTTFWGLFIRLALFAGISCLICTLLAALIASRLRNIITSFVCALLPIFFCFGLYVLYVVQPLTGGRERLLFAGEPWAVLGISAILLLAAAGTHLIPTRTREIR